MKVLVATDDLTFSVSLSHAYKEAGHDVSAGLPELYLGLRDFDLIHFHWPEELTGWAMPPSPRAMRRLLDRLDALKPETKMVCTVHNLLPHADRGGESEALYNAFYARMDLIGHFHESSRAAVMARFPDIPASKHVIHGMQDFADLRVHATGKAAARVRLGLPAESIVIAAVGQLRSMGELALLGNAVTHSALPPVHMVRAFRRPGATRISERARRRYRMRSFDRLPGVALEGYIEDADLVAVCEAADIIIIPRLENQLNSGVLPLAMTFGTGIVAPDCGVFREMLRGSMNELYAPGDADAMAKAIARLAAKNSDEVRASNLALSADWGWPCGVARIFEALAK
jgi:glycosyltransferase involved in cell wall biosynthesis